MLRRRLLASRRNSYKRTSFSERRQYNRDNGMGRVNVRVQIKRA